jgi:hypothetical protein
MALSEKLADIGTESLKAAPPVAVVVYQKGSGLTLNEWVMIATLAYIGLQSAWLLWRWWKAASKKGWAPE